MEMQTWLTCRLMFWVDVTVALPLDGIIAGALGIQHRAEDQRAEFIALVRWLKIVSGPPRIWKALLGMPALIHTWTITWRATVSQLIVS